MGCGPSEATRLLPLAATRLSETHPELRLTVLYGLNEALMPWVRQGEIDLALSSVPGTASDPDLVHERLLTDSATVVARSGHPLAGRRAVKVTELVDRQWVLARRHELERKALDELFLANALKPPEATIETTSTVLMKSVVMHSDFLTFLPRELIYWEERVGDLAALRVAGEPGWSRAVGITLRKGGSLSPAGQALIEALRKSATEIASRGLRRR